MISNINRCNDYKSIISINFVIMIFMSLLISLGIRDIYYVVDCLPKVDPNNEYYNEIMKLRNLSFINQVSIIIAIFIPFSFLKLKIRIPIQYTFINLIIFMIIFNVKIYNETEKIKDFIFDPKDSCDYSNRIVKFDKFFVIIIVIIIHHIIYGIMIISDILKVLLV